MIIHTLTFNNDLQQDAHECLNVIYETMERATSTPITSDINIAILKEYISGLINNYIICIHLTTLNCVFSIKGHRS